MYWLACGLAGSSYLAYGSRGWACACWGCPPAYKSFCWFWSADTNLGSSCLKFAAKNYCLLISQSSFVSIKAKVSLAPGILFPWYLLTKLYSFQDTIPFSSRSYVLKKAFTAVFASLFDNSVGSASRCALTAQGAIVYLTKLKRNYSYFSRHHFQIDHSWL